jgi:cell division transport system permease protein
MLGWAFVSQSERRLLDAGRLRGATPWVIAIMSFTIVIVAAAGLALANTAGVVARAVESRYSVQVPNGSRNVDAIVRAVRTAPGVISAEAVPEAEMRQTLGRWLGPEARSAELPVPAIVNFDIGAGAQVQDIARRVHAAAPDATIQAHKESLGPLLNSLRTLQWIALALVLLLGAAAAAAVVLAARGALDTHRFTIEVMHGIGATDLQVTRLFQRKLAVEALVGSVGGAAAAGTVLLVLTTGASFAGDISGGARLNGVDLVVLALLPFGLTGLATWVARAAVLAALRQSL